MNRRDLTGATSLASLSLAALLAAFLGVAVAGSAATARRVQLRATAWHLARGLALEHCRVPPGQRLTRRPLTDLFFVSSAAERHPRIRKWLQPFQVEVQTDPAGARARVSWTEGTAERAELECANRRAP